MVHALCRRDRAEALAVFVEHSAADGGVVGIADRIDIVLKLLPRSLQIDGRGGDEIAHGVAVARVREPQNVDCELARAAKLRDAALEIGDRARVARADRPAVVPDLGLHRAAAVAKYETEKGLAVGRGLDQDAFKNKIALGTVAGEKLV